MENSPAPRLYRPSPCGCRSDRGPRGNYIGHTGRWRNLAVLTTGSLRALPTLGLLTLLALRLGIGLATPIVALAVLRLPPLLADIYSGLESVDAHAVDAARAQGMTEA